MAASEWDEFIDEFLRDRNWSLPDLPQYVKIVEGFGIYGDI
jgi:hypothetical protein